jgi:hypothetical protein
VAALTADDCPIDSVQRKLSHAFEQRLKGYKPHARIRLLQVFQPYQHLWTLDRYTEPNMSGCFAVRVSGIYEVAKQRAPLGENLENVMISALHNVKDTRNVRGWNVLVEKVAHGVHEYHSRFFPSERLL